MKYDQRLIDNSTFVMDLDLCQMRLINNAKYPWVLLIPRQENLVEIIDLSVPDQLQLFHEITTTSHIFKELFAPDKLNVAALGNVVPQLHVHIIARYQTDEAWPNPVWNSGEAQAYEPDELKHRMDQISSAYSIYMESKAC